MQDAALVSLLLACCTAVLANKGADIPADSMKSVGNMNTLLLLLLFAWVEHGHSYSSDEIDSLVRCVLGNAATIASNPLLYASEQFLSNMGPTDLVVGRQLGGILLYLVDFVSAASAKSDNDLGKRLHNLEEHARGVVESLDSSTSANVSAAFQKIHVEIKMKLATHTLQSAQPPQTDTAAATPIQAGKRSAGEMAVPARRKSRRLQEKSAA